MSTRGLLLIVATIGVALFATMGICAQDEAGPVAFYPETLHEFSSVLDGSEVVHDFIVQNKGMATLQIERVKTG